MFYRCPSENHRKAPSTQETLKSTSHIYRRSTKQLKTTEAVIPKLLLRKSKTKERKITRIRRSSYNGLKNKPLTSEETTAKLFSTVTELYSTTLTEEEITSVPKAPATSEQQNDKNNATHGATIRTASYISLSNATATPLATPTTMPTTATTLPKTTQTTMSTTAPTKMPSTMLKVTPKTAKTTPKTAKTTAKTAAKTTAIKGTTTTQPYPTGTVGRSTLKIKEEDEHKEEDEDVQAPHGFDNTSPLSSISHTVDHRKFETSKLVTTPSALTLITYTKQITTKHSKNVSSDQNVEEESKINTSNHQTSPKLMSNLTSIIPQGTTKPSIISTKSTESLSTLSQSDNISHHDGTALDSTDNIIDLNAESKSSSSTSSLTSSSMTTSTSKSMPNSTLTSTSTSTSTAMATSISTSTLTSSTTPQSPALTGNFAHYFVLFP